MLSSSIAIFPQTKRCPRRLQLAVEKPRDIMCTALVVYGGGSVPRGGGCYGCCVICGDSLCGAWTIPMLEIRGTMNGPTTSGLRKSVSWSLCAPTPPRPGCALFKVCVTTPRSMTKSHVGASSASAAWSASPATTTTVPYEYVPPADNSRATVLHSSRARNNNTRTCVHSCLSR